MTNNLRQLLLRLNKANQHMIQAREELLSIQELKLKTEHLDDIEILIVETTKLIGDGSHELQISSLSLQELIDVEENN